jgi:hypothetical protein
MRLPPNIRTGPVTWIQALIAVAVLASTLVLGLEKILASEAVASIFTAALGYVFSAGAVERASRTRETADRIEREANGSWPSFCHAFAVSALGQPKPRDRPR